MTEPALVLAPIACAAVLLLSGIAKYGDLEGTQAAFESMRMPKPLTSSSVVRLLPVVEVALGALMLITWGWALAVVAAVVTVLFAAYWVLVLLVLQRGEDVDCGCFGAAGDDRVSSVTLARNSVLVVLAGLAVSFGAGGSGVWPVLRDLSRSDGAWLLMAAAVTVAAVLVVGFRRRPEKVADDELLDYARSPIPFALLRDADGHTTTLRELAAERPQLLVLLSSTCGACHDVAALMPGWSASLGLVEVQTVFTEPLEHLAPEVTPPGVKAWFDVEGGATSAFAAGRPAAVLLGADGLLAGGPVAGKAAMVEFVDDVRAEIEAAGQPDTEFEKAPDG